MMLRLIPLTVWVSISLMTLSPVAAQPNAHVDTLHADTTSIPKSASPSLSGDADGPLTLDLGSCEPGSDGFFWKFGSVQVAVHGRTGDTCQVDYTREIEGGYTTHHCRFSVSDSTVVFPAKPRPTLPDSTRCTVVRTGNHFFDELKDLHRQNDR